MEDASCVVVYWARIQKAEPLLDFILSPCQQIPIVYSVFFIKYSDILGERGSEIQTFWFCYLQAFLLKGMYSVQSLSCI